MECETSEKAKRTKETTDGSSCRVKGTITSTATENDHHQFALQNKLSRKQRKAARKQQRHGKKRQRVEEETVQSDIENKKSREANRSCDDQPRAQGEQPTPTKKDVSEEDESSLQGALQEYAPTSIPSWEEAKRHHHTGSKKSGGDPEVTAASSLGKWFPNAIVMKSSTQYTNHNKTNQQNETETKKITSSIVLFYQYVTPPWPESRVSLLIAYLIKICQTKGYRLGGRIRVAQEGVNVTLSAADIEGDHSSSSARLVLRQFARDLQHFDPIAFGSTDFKYIDHLRADRHFKDLKIIPVRELVFYGISPQEAPIDTSGGVHLAPRDFHQMLCQQNTVVVDVRNHYEAAIGRFDGQEVVATAADVKEQSSTAALTKSSDEAKPKEEEEDQLAGDKGSDTHQLATSISAAARYIDPKMRKSTDFPTWLEQEETKKSLKDKHVLLYCTGGEW